MKCSGCEETKVITIDPTGIHNYVDGKCTMCGKEDPEYKKPELPPVENTTIKEEQKNQNE